MKVYIESRGCSRRKAEIAKFHEYFKANGYSITPTSEQADYIVVSTCAFKKDEENESVERINELWSNKGKMLVYGCLPDIAPTRFRELPPTEYITPKNINDIDRHFENIKIRFSAINDVNVIPGNVNYSPASAAVKKFIKDFEVSRQFLTRTVKYSENRIKGLINRHEIKYYLFTSTGCLGTCSYCAIRRSIGLVRSKPVMSVIKEFENGVASGYYDFVLSGDDVGAYGYDNESSFPLLLSHLLERADAMSIENNGSKGKGISFHIEELNPRWIVLYARELLELSASKRIKSILCPIQSGSNRILHLMERGHDAESAMAVLAGIRAKNPTVQLFTQMMIGFPTETDEEFYDTLEFIRKVRFEAVTIFPYDRKEHTKAAALEPPVMEHTLQERMKFAQHYLSRHDISVFLSCPK